MFNLNTELTKTLLANESLDEFFRQHLEIAINDLLQAELSAFLGYEKYSIDGWGSGNSRNGSYERTFETKYGKLNLRIPRDRNGEFQQQTLPEYKRRTDDLETTVIQLYSKGITTREISDIIEKMYGYHYTPTTVSNITKVVEEQAVQFHNRQISSQYAVVYLDATYLNLRRDSVSKEALHVIMGITPDGYKEILDYAIYPTEAAANYEEMIVSLKNRGLEQVLLFVSDGLQGMRDAVLRQFPSAEHQQCWVHVSRSVSRHIRNKDRAEILDELKAVYRATSKDDAQKELQRFLDKHAVKYPRIRTIFESDSLFSFFLLPAEIRSSIYTSNLIENNNKGLKHKSKVKEQFPNEDSLDRFVCSYYSEYNRKQSGRIHKGFKKAMPELLEMFNQKYNKDNNSTNAA